MRHEKYLYVGIGVSIILHALVFLAFNIKISIQKPIKNQIVYIKTIKNEKPSVNISPKLKSIKKVSEKHISKPVPTSISVSKSNTIDKPNYNLTIPSFEKLGKSQPSPNTSKTKSSVKKSSHPENPISPKKSKSPSPSKPSQETIIKPKPLKTLGSDQDLLDYLDNVFHYMHENCKGMGILAVSLYKDGSLKIVKVISGNPVCPNNLQASPMPNSIMENEIDFLIYFP